jgi:hypothetical protein
MPLPYVTMVPHPRDLAQRINPALLRTIAIKDGNRVRRLCGSARFHRQAWFDRAVAARPVLAQTVFGPSMTA